MKQIPDKAEGIEIAYIGGGSREWAFKLMGDLALEGQMSGTVRLYDLDCDAAAENEKVGNSLSAQDVPGKWIYKAVTTLEEALTGAQFVIVSILPGSFSAMHADVHLPEKYGIYQSVGDTSGPGGLMRALRTIPSYVEIAKQISRFSPDAWVINYTNPMTLCVATLYEVFPGIKAFGCCHEVFWTQELLAEMLGDMNIADNATREEIAVNVLGINHFTWIDKASYKGTDLFPVYHDFVDKHFDKGYSIAREEIWDVYFRSKNRVKFDLFRKYGLIAAAGDRHLAEFLPWYLKNPETVAFWGFHLTPVEYRIKNREKINRFRRRLIAGEETFDLSPSGEWGVRQIKALLGLGDFITNVNVPNIGQIKGLPHGSVVETNALLSYNNITPVIAGKLPVELESLVLRHCLNHKTVLYAGLNKSRDAALHALLNDPLSRLDPDNAGKLLDEMLSATKEFLPGWNV